MLILHALYDSNALQCDAMLNSLAKSTFIYLFLPPSHSSRKCCLGNTDNTSDKRDSGVAYSFVSQQMYIVEMQLFYILY